MELRPVAPTDASLLLEWSNEPEVRRTSFNTDPIEWKDHCTWLNARLASPDSALFIAVDTNGEGLGQVRFERLSADAAEIGVSLAPRARGRFLAAPLIGAGVVQAFERWDIEVIRAQVRESNTRSRRAFVAADFDHCGETTRAGVGESVLVYERKRKGYR
jgi:RimJ/RimL family protein N-acetyltransferase